MLFNLALKNIKKSIKDYSIYFFTLVVAVCIFYVFNSIDSQTSMIKLTESKYEMIQALVVLLGYVSVFVSVILGFLIIYSNNFLIKRRKKEIGLYLTLGMSKRKVSTILVIETLLVGLCSLIIGLLCGVGLSQFLSIFTAKLFEVDMSTFKFIFSSFALFKTLMYFGIIFVLVMIFNIISLSRYKLIDLLNASKKNEKIKIRNKYVTFISFISSISLLVYAYKLLFDGVLFMLDSDTLKMIIAGALGTFLLFFSLAGFFLKVFQTIKRVYLKNLNMFVLKQVNNKVNTSVISTTIISLMLLLTIGILSGSMSLANVFNSDLKENNLTDFTLYNGYNVYEQSGERINTFDLRELSNDGEFKKYVKETTIYDIYNIDTITIESLVTNNGLEKIKKDFGTNVELDSKIPIMKESDYIDLMKCFNKEKLIVDIEDDEYIELVNIEQIIGYYSEALEKNNTITIDNTILKPATNKIVEVAVSNYNGAGNDGIIVISDKLLENHTPLESRMVGNYVDSDDLDLIEDNFEGYLKSKDIYPGLLRTKLQMETSSIGIKAIVTFVGLYLGIIFAVSSATVLAIGQLSESSDNKERFRILKQIGADDKLIKRALFSQISIAFILPLVVALFHSYFGLRELNGIIKLLGNIDLTNNIIITTLFIVVVYGGYFIATYLCSRSIIKDNK